MQVLFFEQKYYGRSPDFTELCNPSLSYDQNYDLGIIFVLLFIDPDADIYFMYEPYSLFQHMHS